jgi:hypothetical protein
MHLPEALCQAQAGAGRDAAVCQGLAVVQRHAGEREVAIIEGQACQCLRSSQYRCVSVVQIRVSETFRAKA